MYKIKQLLNSVNAMKIDQDLTDSKRRLAFGSRKKTYLPLINLHTAVYITAKILYYNCLLFQRIRRK